MNNTLKTFIYAVAIGIVTMILGAVTMKVVNPNASIKSMLLTFFIVGFVLYLLIEITGTHKSFCINYLKTH